MADAFGWEHKLPKSGPPSPRYQPLKGKKEHPSSMASDLGAGKKKKGKKGKMDY